MTESGAESPVVSPMPELDAAAVVRVLNKHRVDYVVS